jgi:hypothetical protein
MKCVISTYFSLQQRLIQRESLRGTGCVKVNCCRRPGVDVSGGVLYPQRVFTNASLGRGWIQAPPPGPLPNALVFYIGCPGEVSRRWKTSSLGMCHCRGSDPSTSSQLLWVLEVSLGGGLQGGLQGQCWGARHDVISQEESPTEGLREGLREG